MKKNVFYYRPNPNWNDEYDNYMYLGNINGRDKALVFSYDWNSMPQQVRMWFHPDIRMDVGAWTKGIETPKKQVKKMFSLLRDEDYKHLFKEIFESN